MSGAPGDPDAVLGVSRPSTQFGLLGTGVGRTIALDLNETHAISLFGVQGGGKSYTLGSILEMASLPVPGVNRPASPLASIVFHYSETSEYEPEFLSMIHANGDEGQREALHRRYGARPAGLDDVVLLVPEEYVEERQAQYPGVLVHPLAFAAAELKIAHWKFLMGAVGNQSGHIRLVSSVREMRHKGRTVHPHGAAQIHLAGLAQAPAKGQCGVVGTQPRQNGGAETG
ncbi:hypothetical protein AB0D42_01330 [Streptomyces sp. NPDC048304]|uniref:hypothetical protein n=1 Tax=Streptomyces sp. NPDC048304 TaxID=3154820 RepID=UPI0033FA5F0D